MYKMQAAVLAVRLLARHGGVVGECAAVALERERAGAQKMVLESAESESAYLGACV